MNTQGIRAGKAFVELFANNTQLKRVLRQSEQMVRSFGNHVQQVGRDLVQLGAAASVPIAISTKVFTGFDDQMRTVKAVTQATAQQFDLLTKRAKHLGRTTSFTASQVASAMLELGRAGFDPKEIDQAIDHVLALSRATDTDLAEATGIATGTLRAFNLETEQTARVADILAATANNSAQTLTDLGEAMKYAAPIALEFGLSLEDTAKALGTLAQFNLKGSMAGTALRTIMLNMVDPKVQKRLRALGVETKDAHGNLRSLADIATDLGRATKSMGNAERLAVFKDVFGKRAVASGAKLTTAQFQKLIDAIDSADGIARRTALEMDSGLGGALRRLLSVVEGVGIALGESIAKPLAAVADWTSKVAGKMTEWIELNKKMAILLTLTLGPIVALGSALTSLGVMTKMVSFAFSGLKPILTTIKGAFTLMGTAIMALGSPIGMIGAAFTGLAGILILHTARGGKAIEWLIGKFINLKNEVAGAWQEIGANLASGDIGIAAKILWLTLKMEWQKGATALQKIWFDFKAIFQKISNDIFYSFVGGIATVWRAIEIGSIETINFLQNVWNKFSTFFQKLWVHMKYAAIAAWNGIAIASKVTWEVAKGEARKAANVVKHAFNITFDSTEANRLVDQEVRKEIQKIRESNEPKQRNERYKQRDLDWIDKQATKRQQQLTDTREAKRAASKDFHDSLLDEIANEYSNNSTNIDSEHQKDIDQSLAELEAAKAEWKAAIEASKAKRNAEPEGTADEGKPKEETLGQRLSKAIQGLQSNVDTVKASVSGGFSGFNRFGLEGKAADRTAKATEATAKTVKDILTHQRSQTNGEVV